MFLSSHSIQACTRMGTLLSRPFRQLSFARVDILYQITCDMQLVHIISVPPYISAFLSLHRYVSTYSCLGRDISAQRMPHTFCFTSPALHPTFQTIRKLYPYPSLARGVCSSQGLRAESVLLYHTRPHTHESSGVCVCACVTQH